MADFVKYGQGVQTVQPTLDGTGARPVDVPAAGPAAFGAQIADAQQHLGEAEKQAGGQFQETGNKGLDVAAEFARMATTSKVENDFASQYATGAAALRQKFDSLDDKDKIGGSIDYINGLNNLGQSFTGDKAQGGPLYKELMSQLIGRHIFSETTGINKEVVDSTLRLGAQSKMSVIAANNGYAAANYDNPTVVDQMQQSNAGLRTLQVMDAGHDPTTPEGAALISETQRKDTGSMADGMVKAALADGDVATAMRIRGTYNDAIPGYQQLQADNVIHAASMQQFGSGGVSALAAGQRLPQVASAPPATVQAMVANTAQTSGINPNDALTVATIESSMGKNVGSRGTIGQDKGSAGQPLDVQAKALCDNWKAAHDPAAAALGREPQGWEQYIVYQQGVGGGAALLKADPNAKAVDVISSLYANPKLALKAITDNGGNVTMSVSDFLDQEKQRWSDSAERAKCDFSGNSPPGDQIMAAHQTPGAVVQPGANPSQDYRNWQRANILNMQQIMAMPSGPAREALLKENQFQTIKRETAAQSYRSDLVNQASQMAQDPKFTSMQQVPPEMHSALLEANPNTLAYMESRAEYNLKHQGGVMGEDATKYGPKYKEVLQDIWNGKTTNVSQLHDAVANDGLTIAGYDLMAKQLTTAKEDPIQKQNENKMNANTFATVRNMITKGASAETVARNPKLESAISSADTALFNAINERKSRNIPSSQYYDPKDKEWIGNDAKVFQITHAQAVAATIKAGQDASKTVTLGDIIAKAKATQDPAEQARLRQQAIDLGFYNPNERKAPEVPLAGGQ